MKRLFLSTLAVFALLLPFAQAADVTWTGSGDTTWSQPDATSWDATYNSGDNVIFGNTGVGTVTLSGALTPGNVTFNNTTGTYQINFVATNTIAATGNLSVSGGGTVQFGTMTNSPSALSSLVTWAGTTSISGGSVLNLTRPGNFGDGTTSVSLDNGTLRLGTDNSATVTTANPFAIGSGGGTIVAVYAGNRSNFALSGAFTGGTGSMLNLQTSGNSGVINDSGLLISNADNSGLLGKVVISSLSATSSGMTNFGAAGSLFTGASSVTVNNGGILGVQFAVADASLSNVTAGNFGGIGARGASGSLAALSNVMTYVGQGGNLVLDNFGSLNNDRLGDSAAIALNNARFIIIGRDANTAATNEVVGSVTLSGGSIVNLDQQSRTNSGVDLTTTSLAAPTKGNSLLIQTDSGKFGSGAGLDTIVVTGSGVNKPTVTNGMISPGIQQYDGGNTLGNFVTFSGDDLVTATYTSYAVDWAGAASNEIVNLTAATTLTGSGTLNIHALRITTGAQNLGGRTIALGSGGLITSSVTTSNGTLDFGANAGYIGGYNGGSQATISAAISGSNGITVVGTSQTVNIIGTNSGLTGGIYINGGTVRLSTGGANGNDVTVNAFGRLVAGTSAGGVTDTIGGLSGSGTVSAWIANNGTAASTLEISPASGSYTFDGIIQNTNSGARPINIIKSGNGTQIFGANSVGTYSGTTTVSTGTLLVNGNFSAASGAVSVTGTSTLGGSGTIGGATTIASSATLSPGNSPGNLTFNNGLTLAGAYKWELAALSTTLPGTNFDTITVTAGNVDITGATINLTLGAFAPTNITFWQSNQTWAGILNNTGAGSLTGTFAAIDNSSWSSLGAFTTTVTANDVNLVWTAVVPEPATWGLLAFSLTTIMVFRRRRQS